MPDRFIVAECGVWRLVYGPHDGHELALNPDVIGTGVDWVHRDIGGLEPNLLAFQKELLERRFLLVLEPDRNRLAVFSGFLRLEDHDIAIVDQGVDHRVPAYAEGEELVS